MNLSILKLIQICCSWIWMKPQFTLHNCPVVLGWHYFALQRMKKWSAQATVPNITPIHLRSTPPNEYYVLLPWINCWEKRSTNFKKACFVKCWHFLLSKDLKVVKVVTDAQPHISSLISKWNTCRLTSAVCLQHPNLFYI